MKRAFPAWFHGTGPAAALLVAGIFLHLLFLVSLRTGWLNPLFNDAMHRFGPGCDFFSIYAAGVRVRLGQSIYAIGDHLGDVPYGYAFRYAPLVAYTLGWALARLPGVTAYVLWLCICEVVLLRNIRLTLQQTADARTKCLGAALWLLFSPYYLELYVGQFTFVTASLVFWAYVGWMRRQEAGGRGGTLADFCWAGAVWLKMMPLLYLPIAVIRRRWVGIATTIVVLIGSFIIYLAWLPRDWWVFCRTNMVLVPTWHAGNQGLMALLYELCGESAGSFRVARIVALAIVGLAFGVVCWRAWKASKRASPHTESHLLYAYAAASATYLLLYKDVWEHHYVLLLPPLILLAVKRERLAMWLPAFLVAALPCAFVLYDVGGIGYNEDPQFYWQSSVSLLHHVWKPLAALWLMAAVTLRSFHLDSVVTKRAHVRPLPQSWGRVASVLAAGVIAVGFGRWAAAAIATQRRVQKALAWSDDVFHKQQRRETCGPAALAAVMRHYGIRATEDEVAALAGTTSEGTTMLGLRNAAVVKGLAVQAWRVGIDQLPAVPCPCILYFHSRHFTVLTGVSAKRFYVADPSLGQRVLQRAELAARWRGELLVVGPPVQEPGTGSHPTSVEHPVAATGAEVRRISGNDIRRRN